MIDRIILFIGFCLTLTYGHGVYRQVYYTQGSPYEQIEYPVQTKQMYVPRMQVTQQTQTREINCCLLKKCVNNNCEETFTCGAGCANMQRPVMTHRQEPQQPRQDNPWTQEDLDNIMKQFYGNTNNNKPTIKPFLPDRYPGNGPEFEVPDSQTIPGISLDNKPTTSKPTKSTTMKDREPMTEKPKPKKEDCPSKDNTIKFPQDQEDFGPTPGYDKKMSYVYNKCTKGTCVPIEKSCQTCPDPFEPNFKLYNVKKECFNCYQMPCVPPK